jgi:hypothetical protein
MKLESLNSSKFEKFENNMVGTLFNFCGGRKVPTENYNGKGACDMITEGTSVGGDISETSCVSDSKPTP